MNKELIEKIRQNKEMYLYLRYNSYLYKRIYRNEITYKELEKLLKEELKKTIPDKLNNLSKKIELANTFLEILK